MARRHLPNLERLRALREVARLGGFSAAADTLGVTQPAVSNQIRQLEQQLGISLLERIGKASKPTPEGEVLIAASSRAFAELETAIDEIARMRSDLSGTLVMATGATATTHLLPPVMVDLRARHPGIDLRVLTGNTADLIPGLLDGSIDLGLLTAPIRDPHLRSRFFFRDRLVCITPPGEAPTSRTIRPRDLKNRQLVLYDPAGDRHVAGRRRPAPRPGDRHRQRRSAGRLRARGPRLVDRLGDRGPRGRRRRTDRLVRPRSTAVPRPRPRVESRSRQPAGHRCRARRVREPRGAAGHLADQAVTASWRGTQLRASPA